MTFAAEDKTPPVAQQLLMHILNDNQLSRRLKFTSVIAAAPLYITIRFIIVYCVVNKSNEGPTNVNKNNNKLAESHALPKKT
jgi:hypothetical protein